MYKRQKPRIPRRSLFYSIALKADEKRETIIAKYSNSVNPLKKELSRNRNSNINSLGNSQQILPQQRPNLQGKAYSSTQKLEEIKKTRPKIHGLENLEFSPINKMDQTLSQLSDLDRLLPKQSNTISMLRRESQEKDKEIFRLRNELREKERMIKSLKSKITRK